MRRKGAPTKGFTMKTKVPTVEVADVAELNRYTLQELYRWLDHCERGNTYLAWYGQCRALGLNHKQAILDTITRYDLNHQNWWLERRLDANTLVQP
jgi:hypothetical protein